MSLELEDAPRRSRCMCPCQSSEDGQDRDNGNDDQNDGNHACDMVLLSEVL